MDKSRGAAPWTEPCLTGIRHAWSVACSLIRGRSTAIPTTVGAWFLSITQTAGDLEAAHAHTRVAQESIVVNPAWQQMEQEAQNRGAQMNSEASQRQHEATMNQIHANTAAMTQGHEQRMNDIRRFGEANTARFNERMQQMDQNKAAFDSRMSGMDRQQELNVDTIRGVSKYSDPATGERVKVEDGYDHTYRSRQDPNVYYQANTPVDVGEVNWQECKRWTRRITEPAPRGDEQKS